MSLNHFHYGTEPASQNQKLVIPKSLSDIRNLISAHSKQQWQQEIPYPARPSLVGNDDIGFLSKSKVYPEPNNLFRFPLKYSQAAT